MAENNTAKRGFAAMDPERRREIASKGGKSSRRTDGKASKTKAVPTSTTATSAGGSPESADTRDQGVGPRDRPQ